MITPFCTKSPQNTTKREPCVQRMGILSIKRPYIQIYADSLR